MVLGKSPQPVSGAGDDHGPEEDQDQECREEQVEDSLEADYVPPRPPRTRQVERERHPAAAAPAMSEPHSAAGASSTAEDTRGSGSVMETIIKDSQPSSLLRIKINGSEVAVEVCVCALSRRVHAAPCLPVRACDLCAHARRLVPAR